MADNGADKLTIDRRQVLQAGGAGLVAATAGCLGFLDDDDSSDVPSYASYVPVTENDDGNEGATVVYLDIAALEELPSDENSDDGSGSDDLPEDPMLALPLTATIAVGVIGGLMLMPLGFENVLDGNETDSSSTPIEEMLFTGSGLVLTGEFDTDALDDRLTAENEDSLRPAMEQVDERGEYTIYANPDPDPEQEEPNRYAIRGEDIVIGTEAELETALDVIVGDADPAHERFDEFAWLLSEAGNGTMLMGAYSPDGGLTEDSEENGTQPTSGMAALESIESATGALGSLTFDDDGKQGTARLAVSAEEFAEETRSELEEAVGSSGEDVEIEFDDGRMTAEATYSEETIQGSESQDSES
jgi:hypothetical protein